MKSKAKLASEFLNNLTDVGGVICPQQALI